MSLADQPAFPRPGSPRDATYTCEEPGMTYRQWLVGMALQGLLANYAGECMPPTTVAKEAVAHADAAIRAQENSK